MSQQDRLMMSSTTMLPTTNALDLLKKVAAAQVVVFEEEPVVSYTQECPLSAPPSDDEENDDEEEKMMTEAQQRDARRLKKVYENDRMVERVRFSDDGELIEVNGYSYPELQADEKMPEGVNDVIHEVKVCPKCFAAGKNLSLADHVCRFKGLNTIPNTVLVWRFGDLELCEVNGRNNFVFCQSLCLFARLCIYNKVEFDEMRNFACYVLYIRGDNDMQILGYFSKARDLEKSPHILSCLLTMPQFRGHGYGRLLIAIAYMLSVREGRAGTPEGPLSSRGEEVFLNYWQDYLNFFMPEIEIGVSSSVPEKRTFLAHARSSGISVENLLAAAHAKVKGQLNRRTHSSQSKLPQLPTILELTQFVNNGFYAERESLLRDVSNSDPYEFTARGAALRGELLVSKKRSAKPVERMNFASLKNTEPQLLSKKHKQTRSDVVNQSRAEDMPETRVFNVGKAKGMQRTAMLRMNKPQGKAPVRTGAKFPMNPLTRRKIVESGNLTRSVAVKKTASRGKGNLNDLFKSLVRTGDVSLVEEHTLVDEAAAKKNKRKRNAEEDDSDYEDDDSDYEQETDSEEEEDSDSESVDDQVVELRSAPLGIENLGSTCYANALIQCLAATPAFSLYALHREDVDEEKFAELALTKNVFRDLFAAHETVNASEFAGKVLPYIFTQSNDDSSAFDLNTMQDSHELFIGLVNLFVAAETDDREFTVTDEVQLMRTQMFEKFGVTVSEKQVCQGCGHQSYHKSLGSHLSLPFSQGNNNADVLSVENMLESFLEDQIGALKKNCDGCKNKNEVFDREGVKLSRLPKVLVLHLMRFNNNLRKINKHVQFDETLDVPSGTDYVVEYKLRALLVHNGGPGLNGGHFVAYANYNGDTWLKYNDDKVEEVRNFDEVKNQRAYMLFYERTNEFQRNSIELARAVSMLRTRAQNRNSSNASNAENFMQQLQFDKMPPSVTKHYHDLGVQVMNGLGHLARRSWWIDQKKFDIVQRMQKNKKSVELPTAPFFQPKLTQVHSHTATGVPIFTLPPQHLRSAKAAMILSDECRFDLSSFLYVLYESMKRIQVEAMELNVNYDSRVPLAGVGDAFLAIPSAFHSAAARELRTMFSHIGFQLAGAAGAARGKPHVLQSMTRITIRPEGNSNDKGKVHSRTVRPEHEDWDEYRFLWNGDKYAVPIAYREMGSEEGATFSDLHFMLEPGHVYAYNTRKKVLVSPSSVKPWEEKSKQAKNGAGSVILSCNRIEWSFFVSRTNTTPPPGYESMDDFKKMIDDQDLPMLYDVAGDVRTVEKQPNKLRAAFRQPEVTSRQMGENRLVKKATRWAPIVYPQFRLGRTTKQELRVPYLEHCFHEQYIRHTRDPSRTSAMVPRSNFAVLPSLRLQSNFVMKYRDGSKVRTPNFMHKEYTTEEMAEISEWKEFKH